MSFSSFDTLFSTVWDRQTNADPEPIDDSAAEGFGDRDAVVQIVLAERRDKATTTVAQRDADVVAQGRVQSIVVRRRDVAVKDVDDVDLGRTDCALEAETTVLVVYEERTDHRQNASGLGDGM